MAAICGLEDRWTYDWTPKVLKDYKNGRMNLLIANEHHSFTLDKVHIQSYIVILKYNVYST